MTWDSSARNAPEEIDIDPSVIDYPPDDGDTRPSLPIILLSSALGVAGGVIGLYVTYTVLGWDLPVSVFVAVFSLCLGLGVTGAGLSALTGSRAALANIVFSCGLIAISFLFFAVCGITGALGAALLLANIR